MSATQRRKSLTLHYCNNGSPFPCVKHAGKGCHVETEKCKEMQGWPHKLGAMLEMCEGKARSALTPLCPASIDAFALPATNLCQFAPAEHLGQEFCVLMAYRMFCVSLCSTCKKKKDCIGRMSSSNMLNKYCTLFMRL